MDSDKVKVKAKVISLVGKVAAVRIDNRSILVSRSYIGHAKVGDKVEIPDKAVSTGTEYGIDWSLIVPEGIVISPEEIQSALASHSIFTLEDMKHNPNVFVAALNSLTRKKSAELFKAVQKVIGGT